MILFVHPFTTGKFTIFFAAYHPQVINPVVGWIDADQFAYNGNQLWHSIVNMNMRIYCSKQRLSIIEAFSGLAALNASRSFTVYPS